MTTIDRRIADALRGNSPPPRDSAFRLQTLERRERQRFRRRALSSLAVTALMATVSALSVSAGGQSYIAGSVLLSALVLILAGVIYLPGFGRLLRHFSV